MRDGAARIEIGPRVHHPAAREAPCRPDEPTAVVDNLHEPEAILVADPVEEAAKPVLEVGGRIVHF